MIRALHIDAKAGEVREVKLPDLASRRLPIMNRAIGGYIEIAHMWPTGDVLFVDEDGLRHDWAYGFVFLPRRETLLGNGIVLGREVEGEEYPDGYGSLDPVITADELRALIRFFVR